MTKCKLFALYRNTGTLAQRLECSPGRVIPKTLKMELDTTLLNTQHYKVRFKGKVEQSREWSSAPPLHLGVVAIEKGAFGSPSTMVANFTLLYIGIPDII